MDANQEAWEILKEIVKEEPWEYEQYGGARCFFCVADYPEHHPDCPYEKARRLILEG